MLSLRTRRGPLTGSLKTPVNTVFPFQGTAFGMPTLTERSRPLIAPDIITRSLASPLRNLHTNCAGTPAPFLRVCALMDVRVEGRGSQREELESMHRHAGGARGRWRRACGAGGPMDGRRRQR